jgi:hypothetical protein
MRVYVPPVFCVLWEARLVPAYFVVSVTLPLNALASIFADPDPNFVFNEAPGPYFGRSSCALLKSLLIPPLNDSA